MSGRVAKICHVITMLELGGAQQNTLYTLQHLDRSRFEPILITGAEGPLVEEARSIGVRSHFLRNLVRPVAPSKDARAFIDLARILRDERPDVVHTHSSKAGILGRFAAAIAGVPVIIHSIHGWGFHHDQSAAAFHLFVGLERLAARATTAFVAVSRANAREGEDLDILREDRVHLIRSGIRLAEFRPASEEERRRPAPWPEPPAGGVTVGMVACFKPQKAPLDFVRVAAEVLSADPRVRFVLIGDGDLRGEIESLIRERGIEGAVALLGWRRDVPDLMRRFDILLHTARWEGLPRVFPEGMATGLPVVATRVDGAPEAIEDGVNGRLFDPGDIGAMARAVLDLAHDGALRERMGRAGLDRVREWDIDEMVRAQEDLYERLLGRARPRTL